MSILSFLATIQKSFQKAADPELAKQQKAYMKGHFPFFGIQKPLRAAIQKEVFVKYRLSSEQELIELLYLLWSKEEREFQYVALDLMGKYKKFLSEKLLSTLEHCIRTRSWWDTVDGLASNGIGLIVGRHCEHLTLMDQWIHDPHLWIRRTALLFQLKWKEKTDEKRLFDYCALTMQEEDFFIRKAIGWALREYSKTNPHSVLQFVEKNRSSLSPLSVREAIRRITP